jgi:hypothetical protein
LWSEGDANITRSEAAMTGDWRPEPWSLLRVAGLPAEALCGLQLDRTLAVGRRLDQAERLLTTLRSAAIADVYDAVGGCQNTSQRRVLLALKRKLHSGTDVSSTLQDVAVADALPADIRNQLVEIGAVQTESEGLSASYESVFTEERTAVGAVLRDRIVGSDWLDEILLSSADLWRSTQWIAGSSNDLRSSARQLRQESALARYLFRSATRTAPFGGFAAVALLRLPQRRGQSVDVDLGSHVDPLPAHQRWQGIAQVNHGSLRRWIHRGLTDTALDNLPLRVAPQRMTTTKGSTVATIAIPSWATADNAAAGAAPSAVRSALRTVPLGPLVQQVLAIAETRSANEVVDRLSCSAVERNVWRRLVESMIETGLLERHLPHTGADHAGLLAMSRLVEQLGDPTMAHRIVEIAEAIADYPQSGASRRAEHVSKLNKVLGCSAKAPLYVDKTVHGIHGEALGISLEELTEVLRPALKLARASTTEQPHQLLCNAFIDEFGARGICTDVAAFVIGVVEDDRLMPRLRRPTTPVSWLNSQLGKSISDADGEGTVSLDVASFDRLDAPPGRFAFAIFAQILGSPSRDQRAGDQRVVLNGVQSGRHKYVSRYLGDSHPTAGRALKSMRAQFAAARDPLPVELLPNSELNFQMHPLLTPWALETPEGGTNTRVSTIPLSDLSVRFDETLCQLRVSSARTGRDVEPVHLGFLRDLNLPDQTLVLRALSPRIAEETASERADVYGLIDRSDALRALPLRRYRPRIQVGRLVLARARWALPFAEIPMPGVKESHATYFRRLSRWRADNDLPARGFVRRLRSGMVDLHSYYTPQYVDFDTPFGGTALQRLISDDGNRAGIDGWLLIDELLPLPEHASLAIDGRPHVAELLVEFEGEFTSE